MKPIEVANEKFIFWRRTPTPGLRFVRVTRWHGDTIPHGKSLRGREVLGWVLSSDGKCTRCFSVRTDVPYDGCREWVPCKMYPDTPISPEGIQIKLPGNPPGELFSTDAVEQIEICHRREFADFWAAYGANEAATIKARAEQQVRAEQAKQAADLEAAQRTAQLAALRFTLPPPRKPKTWLQRLFG